MAIAIAIPSSYSYVRHCAKACYSNSNSNSSSSGLEWLFTLWPRFVNKFHRFFAVAHALFSTVVSDSGQSHVVVLRATSNLHHFGNWHCDIDSANWWQLAYLVSLQAHSTYHHFHCHRRVRCVVWWPIHFSCLRAIRPENLKWQFHSTFSSRYSDDRINCKIIAVDRGAHGMRRVVQSKFQYATNHLR